MQSGLGGLLHPRPSLHVPVPGRVKQLNVTNRRRCYNNNIRATLTPVSRQSWHGDEKGWRVKHSEVVDLPNRLVLWILKKEGADNGLLEEEEQERTGGVKAVSGAWQVGPAAKYGRVGVFQREGNASLLSFGYATATGLDFSKMLSGLLPYSVLVTALLALSYPPSFSWFSKKYYVPALGGIMLSIGIQLSVSDFVVALKRPVPVVLGYIAQYVIKPLLACAVVWAFRVPACYAAGFILMASVSGAQLATYASLLAGADTAISIILTSITTMSSVIVTPLLTQYLLGSMIPVDAMAMAMSILQVVICPVMLGLFLNTFAKPVVDVVRPVMPLLAMVCTSLCIGSPLAMNQGMLLSDQGLQLILPILAFHAAAFSLGYWLCRMPLWRQGERETRTISLCTGMQSSTLAMLLASQFLGVTHSVPPACSVVIMAIMGLSLGSFWGQGHSLRHLVSKNLFPSKPLTSPLYQ